MTGHSAKYSRVKPSPSPVGAMKALAVGFVAAIALSVTGCGPDNKNTLNITINPETTPTMVTHDVSTLISDSGITRYHITAPLWLVFGEAAQPSWHFPEGIFLEKFDNNLKQEATVEADSATYLEKARTWRLDGNVKIRNIQNEKFLTQQLFWNQRTQKIYSDSFIHIERADRVIEGYGFESNDRLTDYEVKTVSGIFPVSQFTGQRGEGADSVSARQNPVSYGPAPIIGHPGVSTAADTAAAFNTPAATDSMSPRRRAIDLRRRHKARNDSASAGQGTPTRPGGDR